MGVYDQIKAAFQDLIAPEIRELRERIDGIDARLSTKIDGVRNEVASLRAELLSEIRRVDTRIDAVDGRIDRLDRDVHTAIDIRERVAALEARQRP